MIFANVIGVHPHGFRIRPADLERIGVFHGSVCWGVWVPDPRGSSNQPGERKHLLISPIHPSVWPFLLRLEIKLRDSRGTMATAAGVLVESKLNIQFAESAISGHHHATWNVVAEAIDTRGALQDQMRTIQGLAEGDKVYTNPELKELANTLAVEMLTRELSVPESLIRAHRLEASYRSGALDCGFLHNRIVDQSDFQFFYDPAAMPTSELQARAEQRQPQSVTCRWMQNLAFFALYGDVSQPLRLQYDAEVRLLKLLDTQPLERRLEQQGQLTTLPANAVASFDTSELYLRVDIIEPTQSWNRYVEASVDYDMRFASNHPGEDDTASGLWHSVCREVAQRGLDLVRISNLTKGRDPTTESGSISLIGKSPSDISDDFVRQLTDALEHRCSPAAELPWCNLRPKATRFRSYTVFLSRRTQMPRADEIKNVIEELAKQRGMELQVVQDHYGQQIDGDVETGVLACDGLLQIVSYSETELDAGRNDTDVLPDLQWLIHEYGLAIGANKPHARVFDVAYHKIPDWTRIVSPRAGEAAGAYKSTDEVVTIRYQFDRVLTRLVQQIDATRRRR